MVAVERAAEVVVVSARHARHADVGSQLHGLACEESLAVVGSEPVAEDIPASRSTDDVWVVLRAVAADVL